MTSPPGNGVKAATKSESIRLNSPEERAIAISAERDTGDAPGFERVLEPIDRVSEILFGVIMALTFTCTLGVATAGSNDVRIMLFGALGCNLSKTWEPGPRSQDRTAAKARAGVWSPGTRYRQACHAPAAHAASVPAA